MEIEHIREEPPGVLFLCAFSGVGRNVSRQRFDKRRDERDPSRDVFGGLSVLRRRTIDNGTASNCFRSAFLEPLPKGDRRSAVVLIVALNYLTVGCADVLSVPEFKARLELRECDIGIGKRGFALEPVNGLKLLDRIALNTDPDPLSNDCKKVDEPPGAENLIEFFFSGRIAAH